MCSEKDQKASKVEAGAAIVRFDGGRSHVKPLSPSEMLRIVLGNGRLFEVSLNEDAVEVRLIDGGSRLTVEPVSGNLIRIS